MLSATGLATRMRDPSFRVECKVDADRLSLVIQIVEHYAVADRRDLLKSECRRQEARKLRRPILCKLGVAADADSFARALKVGIAGVELKQLLEIPVSAGVEPINHDRHPIKVARQT